MSRAGRGGKEKERERIHSQPIGEAVGLIKHPTRLFVVGRAQMGKTTEAVRVIQKRFGDMDRYIVICPSFDTQRTFDPIRHLFKPNDIHMNPKEGKFKEIEREIKNFNTFFRDAQLKKGITKPRRARTLLLIDDMTGKNLIQGNGRGNFSNFACQITHLDCSLMVIAHSPKSVDLNFRRNAENFLVFPSESKDSLDWIVDNFNSPVLGKHRDVKDMILQTWKGRDGKIGEHFLFIHSQPRKLSRFFSDFDHEVVD